MATLLADGYYLKAMENYPWELSEALENLNYTLSYDPEHAGANCLMGQLQMHYLKNYQAAEEYFEAAMASDPEYVCAWEHLVILYIHQKRMDRAQKVLEYAQRIPTMNRTFVLWAMSRILETRYELSLAKRYLKAAFGEVFSWEEQDYLNAELKRLKVKTKAWKKRKQR
ncbi:MAG TPA: hypothetical protein DCG19_09530 [Cryomorphaceae bacterium]|nr:hypothetical protein [Owenweeksia sp.]MBF97679.1 hypothetical protein [Owenweeksia sp.]HAD97636.1 hypothetical protein [Cryomorphaceae bacterium]HBF19319.1 hypothetical protein [Cryomorphaceae bacterium]|tara:strand:+ start:1476 stop:1982 length:507 start_codon:yes stop_codon:yes gene_type:complete